VLELGVLAQQFLHPGLDALQVFGREGAGLAMLVPAKVEIVVEAVLDRRADGQPRFGEQVADRLGHHMRGRVTDAI